MTRHQASTARFLLGWSPDTLARASQVPVSSVYLLERLGSAGADHDRLMRGAFERAGIAFRDSAGSDVVHRAPVGTPEMHPPRHLGFSEVDGAAGVG